MLSGKSFKLIRVKNAVAAGTTAITSDIVDMQGFQNVMFLAGFGTLTATAVTSVKLQQDTDSGGGTMADLASSSVSLTAGTDDNKTVAHDLRSPTKRYVRAYVSRGTANAVLDGIWALLYGGDVIPPTNDATTIKSLTTLVSPAEGTA